MNILNMRIDRNHTKILNERLRNKFISMGWGGGDIENLDLTQDNDLWKLFKSCYNDRISIRRFNSILKIKKLRDNDILIIPHLPSPGKFVVGIVDGDFPDCYCYQENDLTHLNHRIKLKTIYGLDGNLDIHNFMVQKWYAKLSWMRLPFYPLSKYQDIFLYLIEKLRNEPNLSFDKSQLVDYFYEIKKKIKKMLIKELNLVSPSNSNINFEQICRELIESYGYIFEKSHKYQNGGDADLIFEIPDDITSPFELSMSKLYVQIKKHSGTSDEKAILQLLKIMEEYKTTNISQGCAITLGEFSKKALELAEQNDIVTINGDDLVELIITGLF